MSPISVLTGKAGKPVKTPQFWPAAIVITPDGKTAWITGDQPTRRTSTAPIAVTA